MKQKWMAISNPVAGGGKVKRRWPDVKKALKAASIPYELTWTTAPGDATLIVQMAIKEGFTNFLSIGGDGTHHEVVNGICKSGIDHSRCTLGILPIGTGNDWARTLAIPHNLQKAANVIRIGNTLPHSVGKVQFGDGREEFFMNVAGMCLDAAVVQRVPASLVRKFGGMAYLLGGVQELFTYTSPLATIILDSHSVTGKFLTMHAGFGKYCGGGMQFLPHANPTSDNLAITTVQAGYKWKLLMNIHRLFTGSILTLNAANSYSAGRFLVQHADEPAIPIEADGEFLGYSPFEITTLPNAMLVSVP